MIWNEATDVMYNGTRVVSVFCNNQLIWPTTAEPDAFTVFGFSAYQSSTATEDLFGVNIYDSLNRKVYSTNGMHPFSSYEYSGGKFRISAEGVAPFTYYASASSRPWSAVKLHGVTLNGVDTVDMDRPGCLSVTTGALEDSKNTSWSAVDQMMSSDRNYISARVSQKRLNASGMCYRQSPSGVSAAMILFAPTKPTYTCYSGSGLFGVSAETTSFELYRTGVVAGFFQTYAHGMQYDLPLTPISAFDMFNSIEHSGDIRLNVTASTAMKTATNYNDSCFMSVFPAALVSGSWESGYGLSGKGSLIPSSVAKATYNPGVGNTNMYATFGSAEASDHSYVGAYCWRNKSSMSSHALYASATSLNYFASVAVP